MDELFLVAWINDSLQHTGVRISKVTDVKAEVLTLLDIPKLQGHLMKKIIGQELHITGIKWQRGFLESTKSYWLSKLSADRIEQWTLEEVARRTLRQILPCQVASRQETIQLLCIVGFRLYGLFQYDLFCHTRLADIQHVENCIPVVVVVRHLRLIHQSQQSHYDLLSKFMSSFKLQVQQLLQQFNKQLDVQANLACIEKDLKFHLSSLQLSHKIIEAQKQNLEAVQYYYLLDTIVSLTSYVMDKQSNLKMVSVGSSSARAVQIGLSPKLVSKLSKPPVVSVEDLNKWCYTFSQLLDHLCTDVKVANEVLMSAMPYDTKLLQSKVDDIDLEFNHHAVAIEIAMDDALALQVKWVTLQRKYQEFKKLFEVVMQVEGVLKSVKNLQTGFDDYVSSQYHATEEELQDWEVMIYHQRVNAQDFMSTSLARIFEVLDQSLEKLKVISKQEQTETDHRAVEEKVKIQLDALEQQQHSQRNLAKLLAPIRLEMGDQPSDPSQTLLFTENMQRIWQMQRAVENQTSPIRSRAASPVLKQSTSPIEFTAMQKLDSIKAWYAACKSSLSQSMSTIDLQIMSQECAINIELLKYLDTSKVQSDLLVSIVNLQTDIDQIAAQHTIQHQIKEFQEVSQKVQDWLDAAKQSLSSGQFEDVGDQLPKFKEVVALLEGLQKNISQEQNSSQLESLVEQLDQVNSQYHVKKFEARDKILTEKIHQILDLCEKRIATEHSFDMNSISGTVDDLINQLRTPDVALSTRFDDIVKQASLVQANKQRSIDFNGVASGLKVKLDDLIKLYTETCSQEGEVFEAAVQKFEHEVSIRMPAIDSMIMTLQELQPTSDLLKQFQSQRWNLLQQRKLLVRQVQDLPEVNRDSMISIASSIRHSTSEPFMRLNMDEAEVKVIEHVFYVPDQSNQLDVAVGQVLNTSSMYVPAERDLDDISNNRLGKYTFGTDQSKAVLCRLVSQDIVMVRRGGGWQRLEDFLEEFPKLHFRTRHRTSIQSLDLK